MTLYSVSLKFCYGPLTLLYSDDFALLYLKNLLSSNNSACLRQSG
jgi:hypothetical protein